MTLPHSWVLDGQRAILAHCKKLGGPLKVSRVESSCDCYQLKKRSTDTRETFPRFSKLLMNSSPVAPLISYLSSPMNHGFWNVLDRLAVPPITHCRFWDMLLTMTIQSRSGFSDHTQVGSASPWGPPLSHLHLSSHLFRENVPRQRMVREERLLDTFGCFLLSSSINSTAMSWGDSKEPGGWRWPAVWGTSYSSAS